MSTFAPAVYSAHTRVHARTHAGRQGGRIALRVSQSSFVAASHRRPSRSAALECRFDTEGGREGGGREGREAVTQAVGP